MDWMAASVSESLEKRTEAEATAVSGIAVLHNNGFLYLAKVFKAKIIDGSQWVKTTRKVTG